MVAKRNINTSFRRSALDVILASDSTEKTLSGLGKILLELPKLPS
jgi:hypothetical protein